MDLDSGTLLIWAALGAAAFAAGVVDAVIGGGGMVQLPALFAFMPSEREILEVPDEELPSAEEQCELWDWARAAGVSAEDLRKALQPARRNP